MLIGLMGKSGSGKTTVGMLFKELDKNIQIVDVDKIGHEALEDGGVKEELLQHFGSKILNDDGSISRKKVSDIVFNNSTLMQKLCNATLGYMEKKIDFILSKHSMVVLDYALLSKTKYYDMCDLKILVTCPYNERLERVISRDNILHSKYDEIDANSLSYDSVYFDYVIQNGSDKNILRKEVGKIYEKSIVPREF